MLDIFFASLFSGPDRATQPATLLSTDTHQLVLDLDEALVLPDADAAPFRAIAVYQVRQSNRIPVAWVELLSPSNKRGGRHADEYWYKRFDLLESGLVFVELDYLHESPPTFPQIASYRRQEPGAHPYRILVIDPRPDYRKGKIHVTQFDADAPIPTVTIPLSAGDKLDFNFNAPYQKTFEEMLYGLELVDYRELPIHFDRYTPEDQARILTRLLSVRAIGVSDHAPVPLDPLIYADAAAQWALSD